MKIQAFSAPSAKASLELVELEFGELPPEHVEIEVAYCGICHSDLAMIDNDWHMSRYPLVAGHEVVGRVTQVGAAAKRVQVGQTVGLGWYSESCMCCSPCLSGNHNLCPTVEGTIVGRTGGFAQRVRCHWAWATPLAQGLDPAKSGPLFCGGITVFNPLVQFDVRPTDRVGVMGIGGLGHMALKFLRAWGCEVVAFTTSDSKREEALQLGAHRVVNTRDSSEFGALRNSLNLILCTVAAKLDLPALIQTLAPGGRFHTLAAGAEPASLPVFPMLVGQRSFSSSPLGSPATTERMLEFCARHRIEPVTELYPMSKINDALDRLRSGQARYRVVLQNDLG
ncbi:MAG: NAD(P)-dependent alcohol dehydrogenase [Verrucomicrobia bacterium]|nr:NAD(P)-dependent alcohol dehydrogenase [Verrucomicrobiota bacterium]